MEVRSDSVVTCLIVTPSQTFPGLSFLICIQFSQLQRHKQLHWRRERCSLYSKQSSGFVVTNAWSSANPTYLGILQQRSSSVSTIIFSTNMVDRLKYCSPRLLKSSFCDGKQTTSKQIKAQAPKAFPYLLQSL